MTLPRELVSDAYILSDRRELPSIRTYTCVSIEKGEMTIRKGII